MGIGLEEPRGEGDSSFISAVSRESQGGRLLAKIEGCPRFLGVGRSEAQWINGFRGSSFWKIYAVIT